MYNSSFLSRLRKMGPGDLILSYDTLAGVVAFFIAFIFTGGGISETTATGILASFATVSATLFAIVLTGLTIITSFTDRLFLYAWQDVGEFENVVTTFQYNLGLPVVVLLFTLFLQIEYNRFAMLVLIAMFVYMLFSLLDLVAFICRYALQRGEFVKQQVEAEKESSTGEIVSGKQLSKDELLQIRNLLEELENESE